MGGGTAPSASISGSVGEEGGRAVFTVRLAKPTSKRVTVRYVTLDLSARAGFDYARRAAPTELYVDLHTRSGAIRGQLRRVA